MVADDHSGSACRIVYGEPGPVPVVDPGAEIARVRVLGHERGAARVRMNDGGVVVAREQSWNVRTKVVGERRRPERKRASNRERVHGSAGVDEPVTRPD